MKEIIRITLTLTIIAALSGGAISYAHKKTHGKIEQQHAQFEQQALASLFEQGVAITPDSMTYKGEQLNFWVATKGRSI